MDLWQALMDCTHLRTVVIPGRALRVPVDFAFSICSSQTIYMALFRDFRRWRYLLTAVKPGNKSHYPLAMHLRFNSSPHPRVIIVIIKKGFIKQWIPAIPGNQFSPGQSLTQILFSIFLIRARDL